MKSIEAWWAVLPSKFESVLTADPGDVNNDYVRFAEFARYLDALSRPHDGPAGAEAFTRRWSERELAVVYGVAATLLRLEVDTVLVEAGVNPGSGTRNIRGESDCLVLHDLYDRMFVELARIMSQIIIESDDREIAAYASDVESGITAAVLAASFAENSGSYVHAQLLANLKIVGFQSVLTRSRITFDRRNRVGLLPDLHMSVISDLILGLHELSHLRVTGRPADAQHLVSMLASFSVENLEYFSKIVPGTQDVISFLTSEDELADAAVLDITKESEVDSLALDCLKRHGLYQRIDARTTASVMFGVTLLEFCRKMGPALVGSPEPHEAAVKMKALAVLRLSNAIADILSAQDSGQETVSRQDPAFMRALLCHLLEATGWIESLFVDGLRGVLSDSFSGRMRRLVEKYWANDDMVSQHDGSVEIGEIEKWAADQLLRNWIDYSKPLRGTLEADRFIERELGHKSSPRNQETFLYLKDELSEIQ